jgi:hypothetical protein
MQALVSSFVYLALAVSPALAQATTAPSGTRDVPWVWIIVAIIVIGGGIWWYTNRSRGPRL